MPAFQQVSGGACSLTIYRETTPGVVSAGAKGVSLALYSESFKAGNSKKPRTVITRFRGPGKPRQGLPQMSGGLESAAYAPQVGHMARALCNAPTTTPEPAIALDQEAVVELEPGIVGIACNAHGFVQDAMVTITGTTNYDGTYRVQRGVTANVIAIPAPFVAETPAPTAMVYRGLAARLQGDVQNLGNGTVALPVKGGMHSMNPGEKVQISGTGVYDGTYTLAPGTKGGVLVIPAPYVAEAFDGTPVAASCFFRHIFVLPRRQPTVCMEKYIDYEAGAAAMPYSRYGFCKVNGFSFNFGGDDELKLSMDFAVGRESQAAAPLDAAPAVLPAVPFEGVEASVWVAGVRRGDVQKGSVANTFGVQAQAAVGDMGQYSRMPEGDPECKATLTVFVETDALQSIAKARNTVPFAVAVCAATGEEMWLHYPETELDAENPAITGKEGLLQDITVMSFIGNGESVFTLQLVNRVESYA